MYAFTRKILAISAFTLISIAIYPALAPSQLSNERLTQKVEDMQSRLSALDHVPQDIAAIQVQLSNAQFQIKEMSERMTYVMLAIFGALSVKFLEVFGVSLKKKED